MRKIITTTFITLDGVMQAPGGPAEDRDEGFAYGGWQMNAAGDDMISGVLNAIFEQPFELLLGKRTYDIFSSYWPHDKANPNVAEPFNCTKKYVVSHHAAELSWNNSSLITGEDVPGQIETLKHQAGADLWVWGSGNLIQTLLKHHLIDRMHLWIYPITIGNGKRLFAEGTQPENFKLIDSKISTTGAIIATYEPAGELKMN